jgi:GNAT superfamily N-acetyltransferase
VRIIALNYMFVDPVFHRQGVGSLLLKQVVEYSKTVGGRIWLTATPQGKALYEKHGWKVVEDSAIDLGKFGGEGNYVRSLMVREEDKDV